MLCALFIFYQDIKERAVYWFLFPLLGFFLGALFYSYTIPLVFLLNFTFNSFLLSLIILLLFAYTKVVLKKKFINHSFGIGDLLFFYAFGLGFPSMTFIVLFSCSLLFATALFYFLKKRSPIKTVPLAGFMAIFLSIMILGSLFFKSPILYTQ